MKTAGTAGTAPGRDVEDLDDTALLAAAEAERDREAQRDKLRIAYQWCLRHPATTPPPAHAGNAAAYTLAT